MVPEIKNPKSEIPKWREIYVGIEPPPDPQNWIQDQDTLDTWFSSWLWAYETMDHEDTEEILSDQRARHRTGHHFLLGRAHDHRRA